MKSNITKDEIKEYINLNRNSINFIVLFISYCAGFYLIYQYFFSQFTFLERITASLLGFLLQLFGFDVMVSGIYVTVDNLTLKIIDECTAMFGSIVYISCILAYPSDIQKKITGIALGIPSLYIINMIRLVVLAFVGLAYPDIFEYVHTYLWQTIFIIFVIVIWLIWVDRVVK